MMANVHVHAIPVAKGHHDLFDITPRMIRTRPELCRTGVRSAYCFQAPVAYCAIWDCICPSRSYSSKGSARAHYQHVACPSGKIGSKIRGDGIGFARNSAEYGRDETEGMEWAIAQAPVLSR